eukprot:2129758-Alexandrium_andersonii.AAC.1
MLQVHYFVIPCLRVAACPPPRTPLRPSCALAFEPPALGGRRWRARAPGARLLEAQRGAAGRR